MPSSLQALNQTLDPADTKFDSPICLLRAKCWHFLATGTMAEGVANVGKEVFQRPLFPPFYELSCLFGGCPG